MMAQSQETTKSLLTLTRAQANRLKHQPDTPQGLRDQLLLCLLLNEKLAVKTISELRATAVDLAAGVLLLSEEEELALSEETLSTLQQYMARTTPTGSLIQGSVSNTDLHGSMLPSSIYARIDHLGHSAGVEGKLTAERCHAYCDPTVPMLHVRKRVRGGETSEAYLRTDLPPVQLCAPACSVDQLMTGLATLDEWFREIEAIQQKGNLSGHFEHLCQQANTLCTHLMAELFGLQQVSRILPLHALLLRLLPDLEKDLPISVLFELEVSAVASLTQSFCQHHLPRPTAEERALATCHVLLRKRMSEGNVASMADLLTSVVTYAAMHVQKMMGDASAGTR